MFDQILEFISNGNGSVEFGVIAVFLNLVLLAHLIILQAGEAVTFRDYLSKYRYYIWAFLMIFFLSIIPVAYSLVSRLFGFQTEMIRNLSTVAGRIGPLAVTIALEFIYGLIRASRKGK